jgi:photosystem II stability/assembly factor-like uncharacterized protein
MNCDKFTLATNNPPSMLCTAGGLFFSKLNRHVVKKMRQKHRLAYRRFKYLVLLLLGQLLCGQPAAMAEMPFPVLHQPALQVAHPDKVVLISIAKAGHRLVAVGEQGVIIYSDDSGQTWRQADVPVNIVITSIGFATPQDGWAAADYGVVLHTTDGGITWHVQLQGDKVLELMTEAASQLAAADPNEPDAQRAVRRANIFNSDGPDKPFLTVTALNSQKAIIFGAYRMTVITSDAGRSWQDWSLHVSDPVSHNMYGAAWIGSSLFIAGEAGTLLRSDDQGNTYTLLNSPTETTFLGVADAGGGAVLAYGVAGTAYRSTDKGQSWSAVNIPSQSDLTAAVKLKSNRLVMLTENGQIFVSDDQAATFNPVSSTESMLLFDAIQADDGNLVIVGSGGVSIVPESALHG